MNGLRFLLVIATIAGMITGVVAVRAQEGDYPDCVSGPSLSDSGLSVGATGVVTATATVETRGFGAQVVETLAAGASFLVLAGPCGDWPGYWYVRTQSNNEGWISDWDVTVESEVEHRKCNFVPGGGDESRALVLIQGFTTHADNRFDYDEAWASVMANTSRIYGYFIYFSYSDTDPMVYEASDTYQGIWNHHVPILRDTLSGCRAELGEVSFDLIGHSMGGVVAMEYIKHDGLSGAQVGWVKHVITLDSPVNGSSLADAGEQLLLIVLMIEAYKTGTNVETMVAIMPDVVDSQSVRDMAAMHSDRENYVFANRRSAEVLASKGVSIWTIGNLEDAVVPPEDSVIDGYGIALSLGSLLPTDLGGLAGHSQVTSATEVMNEIKKEVAD